MRRYSQRACSLQGVNRTITFSIANFSFQLKKRLLDNQAEVTGSRCLPSFPSSFFIAEQQLFFVFDPNRGKND